LPVLSSTVCPFEGAAPAITIIITAPDMQEMVRKRNLKATPAAKLTVASVMFRRLYLHPKVILRL
jgi:hypothetical protein